MQRMCSLAKNHQKGKSQKFIMSHYHKIENFHKLQLKLLDLSQKWAMTSQLS